MHDKQFIIGVLLHTADINNPGKNLDLFLVWNSRLYQEFDKEVLIFDNLELNALRESETKKAELNPEELSKLFKGCCVAIVQRIGIFKPKV